MSSSSDSDFSGGSAPNEEDLKMQKLLAEWDEKDAEEEEYVDSEGDSDDEEAAAKKKALLKKSEEEEEEEEEEVEEEDEASSSESESEDGEESSDSESEGGEEEDSDDDEDPAAEDEEEGMEEVEEVEAPKAVATGNDSDEDDDDHAGEPIKDKFKKKPKKKRSKKASKKVTDPDENDNEEDAEMKKLLANWDADMGTNEDEEEEDEEDDDDDSQVSERDIVLEDNVIDHIVLAADDLEAAMAEFEKKTGLAAVIAGTIKGLGIKCARISFEDATYLEIIAPDPKGPGPIGELIKSKKIKELTPFHFAIRTSKAEQLKDEVTKFGYTPDHITMFGSKADGTPRKWEMLYLYGHKMGGTCPFFINWANSDHPCATLPIVGKLKKLTVRAPEDDPMHKLLDHIPVEGLNIETGKKKLSFSFKTPEGTVKFSTDKAVGFKFPGFEADVGAIPGDDGEQDAEVVFEDPKLPELLPVSDADYEDLPPPAY